MELMVTHEEDAFEKLKSDNFEPQTIKHVESFNYLKVRIA
jgi:hypothetical protein